MDWEALGVDDPFAPNKSAIPQRHPPNPPRPTTSDATAARIDRTGSSNLGEASRPATSSLGLQGGTCSPPPPPPLPSAGKKGKRSKRRTKKKAGGSRGEGRTAESEDRDKLKGSTCARIIRLLSRIAPGGASRRRNSTDKMAAMAASESLSDRSGGGGGGDGGGVGGGSALGNRTPSLTSASTKSRKGKGKGKGKVPPPFSAAAAAAATAAADLDDEGDWGGSVEDPWAYPAMPQECWGEAVTDWQVRGATYLGDSKKVPSVTPHFEFKCTDIVGAASTAELKDVSGKAGSRASLLAQSGSTSFVLVVNIILPISPATSVCTYFTLDDLSKLEDMDTPFGRVANRFFYDKTEDGDRYRDQRFKLIPSIVEGPWIVKRGIGQKPALVGTKLNQTYYHGANYLEICLDIGSSALATASVNLCISHAEFLVTDVGFVIQGDEEDELPEELLAAQQCRRVVFTDQKPLVRCREYLRLQREQLRKMTATSRAEAEAIQTEAESASKRPPGSEEGFDWSSTLAHTPFACR